jgi:hypothetical protein
MRSRVVGVVLWLAVGATACATTSAGGAAVAPSSSSLPGPVSSGGSTSQPPPVAGSPTGPTAARSYIAAGSASDSALPRGCIHGTLHIVHHLNSDYQQALCMNVGSVLEVDMPKESHGPWAPATITPTAGISVTSDLDAQQTLHVVARADASGSYTLNTVTDDGPNWSGPNTSWMLTITVQH